MCFLTKKNRYLLFNLLIFCNRTKMHFQNIDDIKRAFRQRNDNKLTSWLIYSGFFDISI